LAKAEEYFRIWKDSSSKPETERRDFYSRVSDLPAWMICRYQEILAYDPDHPYREDMLSAIQELEQCQQRDDKAIDGD